MTGAAATGLEWRISEDLVAYPTALESMRSRIVAIRAGAAREQVWLLEHPPLYTGGTSAQAGDLSSPSRLDTFATGRGGQWTYHGPGQLVAYVMLDLSKPHGTVAARDIHAYVGALERWLIAAVGTFGVVAGPRAGRVGIWVQDPATSAEDKLAAIGVRVTRWVSWHGVSLNVHPNLEHFSGIVPCGIRDHGVISLRALGLDTTIKDAQRALRDTWPLVFG